MKIVYWFIVLHLPFAEFYTDRQNSTNNPQEMLQVRANRIKSTIRPRFASKFRNGRTSSRSTVEDPNSKLLQNDIVTPDYEFDNYGTDPQKWIDDGTEDSYIGTSGSNDFGADSGKGRKIKAKRRYSKETNKQFEEEMEFNRN